MARVRWLVLLSLGFASPLLANEPQSSLQSQFQIKQHLFGETIVLDKPAPLEPFSDESPEAPKKKSVGLAAVYSMLLPGMGELYANNFSSGKYFLIGEGVLWLTYTVFEVYGNSIRDDARSYAVSRAGVNPNGKDDQFFVDIGNFINLSSYNEAQLQSRNPEKVYDPTAGYNWQWESEAARASYEDQRVAADNMFNNQRFVVGAVIVNHVASAINAARSAILHNKNLDTQSGELRFKAGVLGGLAHPHGIFFTVSKGL